MDPPDTEKPSNRFNHKVQENQPSLLGNINSNIWIRQIPPVSYRNVPKVLILIKYVRNNVSNMFILGVLADFLLFNFNFDIVCLQENIDSIPGRNVASYKTVSYHYDTKKSENKGWYENNGNCTV